jgi:predicted regulator of Ras-like GTPase activity (Roadblock/LC7/MglB family)
MLKDILNELGEMDWMVGSAVIRRDGVLMASRMSIPVDSKDACAIMSATIIGAAKNITTKCRIGFPKRIIIQAKMGDIIISEAGSKAVLVCAVNDQFDHSSMIDDIERAAQRIDSAL